MSASRYPALFQLNTRVRLSELARELGRPATLDAVNYAGHRSQCTVELPWGDLAGRAWRLADRMGTETYDRAGEELATRGLYLDLPAWGYHAFTVDRDQPK